MTYFRNSDELEQVLTQFLETFLNSTDGEQAAEIARGRPGAATALLRTSDPDVDLCIDFAERTVVEGAADEPAITIQIRADDLHDLLLERLDPVQISRLYETDSLLFSGSWTDLGGLVVLATPLQAVYVQTIKASGRDDLLDTPLPPTKETWSSDGPPRELIGHRRPWQRPQPQRA